MLITRVSQSQIGPRSNEFILEAIAKSTHPHKHVSVAPTHAPCTSYAISEAFS